MSHFKAKMHQIRFRLGSAPDPAAGAYSALPDPLAGFKGSIPLRRTSNHSISWTAKKTNEWVLNKAGVKKELLDAVKATKLAYYGHTMRKQGSCVEKEIMQGTMPGARRRGRPRMAWTNNIKTWTGLPVEESIRMTEDRDKWRKYVHGVANPRIEDG